MLDTGFTGFLAINKQDLEGLYWQFLRKKVVGIFAFGGEFSSWYFDFGMNNFGEINHEGTKSAKGRKEERKELFLIYW